MLSQLSKKKSVLAALISTAVVALLASTVGYSFATSGVALTVDGKKSSVQTFGDTVREVLDSEGIEVGKRDVVLPSLDSPVDDGADIEVKYARELDLTVDGKPRSYWTTETEVASAMEEVGMTLDGAELSLDRDTRIGRSGVRMSVVTPKQVTVKVGNAKPTPLNLPVATVGELLDEVEGIDADDRVKPSRATALTDGARIVVTKIGTRTKTVPNEPIPSATVKREDDELTEGETETVREGVDGIRSVTYLLSFRNGKVVDRVVKTQQILKKPVDEIVKVGTKPAEPEQPDTPSTTSGNTGAWDRIAQCESGGNWSANTGNGYYGGLQFSPGTWRAYGGSGMPHQNSRAQQIAIAERVRAAEGGYGAWPHCGKLA